MSVLSTTFMALRHVEWSERLSVGVGEIDEQHRELHRRIDLFLRCTNGEAWERRAEASRGLP